MPRLGTQKRTIQASRRKEAGDLYLRGVSQAEIAARLGVNQSTVSRDLASLREEWLARSVEKIDARKAEELAKIDRLESEYWDAWIRSREVTTERTVRGRGNTAGADKVEQTIKESDRDGDPRFLAGVQWCIERRCSILGLDAPKKVAPTDTDGNSFVFRVEYVNKKEPAYENDRSNASGAA